MKAAGIPLVGADPVTTAMLIAAWTVMPSVSPHPSSMPRRDREFMLIRSPYQVKKV